MSRISEITYKRTVLKRISKKTDSLTQGVDAADINLEDITFVMSSNAIIKWFEGCEFFALQKCVNQLCEKGAVAKSIQVIIDIPNAYEEKLLGKIIQNINDGADVLGISISQCKVYYAETDTPIAHINMLGTTQYNFCTKNIKPNMDVVMVGSIAVGSTAVLSRVYQKKLLEKYSAKFVNDCLAIEQMMDIRQYMDIVIPQSKYLHAVTDTGVFGAIWEIASMSNIGIEVDIKKIPVWQETVEIAEFFDANPYLMDGTGALLVVCEHGEELAKSLTDNGFFADVIGKTTDSKDRVVINGDEKRYLEPPRGDELYNFL